MAMLLQITEKLRETENPLVSFFEQINQSSNNFSKQFYWSLIKNKNNLLTIL
jgi:hypothetical protein